MSECKNIKNMISPYLDGELSEEDRLIFESHAAECRECSAELDRMRKTIAMIKCSEYIPERDILNAVLEKTNKRKSYKKLIRYGSTIAACFIAVVLIGRFTLFDAFNLKMNGAKMLAADDASTVEEVLDLRSGEEEALYYNVTSGESVDIADANSQKNEAVNDAMWSVNESEEYSDDEIDQNLQQETLAEDSIAPSLNQTGDEVKSSASMLTASPHDVSLNPEMIKLCTQIYAADYTGKIRACVLSYSVPQTETEVYQSAEGFNSYIIPYSDEIYANADGEKYILDYEEGRDYLLYIEFIQQ